MNHDPKTPRRSMGIVILLISAVIGLLVSLYAYFTPLSGVTGTPGALLAIAVTIAILMLGGALTRLPTGGRRIAGYVALIVLLAGNCFAGALLHEWVLSAAMAVGFVGLLIDLSGAGRIPRTPSHAIP
jgi:hypothetical protein